MVAGSRIGGRAQRPPTVPMTRGRPPGNVPGSTPRASILWIAPHDRHQAPGESLRLRLRRAADLAWSPADAVLAARDLSNLVVVSATLGVAALAARDGGPDGLIINLPGLAVTWGGLYGLIRLGRWWRGVRPPDHLPRRPARPATRWHRAKAS